MRSSPLLVGQFGILSSADVPGPVTSARGGITSDVRPVLVSVRRLHEGLQGLRSIRRIEARRRKASALWLRFSQSLARRIGGSIPEDRSGIGAVGEQFAQE